MEDIVTVSYRFGNGSGTGNNARIGIVKVLG